MGVTGKPLATSCSLTAPCADHMHCQGPEGGATCVCTPGHVPDTNATCGQCPLTSDQVGKGELTASVIRMEGWQRHKDWGGGEAAVWQRHKDWGGGQCGSVIRGRQCVIVRRIGGECGSVMGGGQCGSVIRGECGSVITGGSVAAS